MKSVWKRLKGSPVAMMNNYGKARGQKGRKAGVQ
jgi:hypothetical protein